MSWIKDKKAVVDLSLYDDIDEDLIVEGLTEDEIRELNASIDPEVRIALVCVLLKAKLSIVRCLHPIDLSIMRLS